MYKLFKNGFRKIGKLGINPKIYILKSSQNTVCQFFYDNIDFQERSKYTYNTYLLFILWETTNFVEFLNIYVH